VFCDVSENSQRLLFAVLNELLAGMIFPRAEWVFGFLGGIVVLLINEGTGIGNQPAEQVWTKPSHCQGGRTAGTDAAVTVIAGNPGSAKPVVATGTIDQSKAISITLTAETDRAYLV
jgi:hypothetical protein